MINQLTLFNTNLTLFNYFKHDYTVWLKHLFVLTKNTLFN